MKYGNLQDGLAELTGGIAESLPEVVDVIELKHMLAFQSIVTAFYPKVRENELNLLVSCIKVVCIDFNFNQTIKYYLMYKIIIIFFSSQHPNVHKKGLELEMNYDVQQVQKVGGTREPTKDNV